MLWLRYLNSFIRNYVVVMMRHARNGSVCAVATGAAELTVGGVKSMFGREIGEGQETLRA